MNETLPISMGGTGELFPPESLTLSERNARIRAYGTTALTSYLQMCREIAVAQVENAEEIEACGFESWCSDLGLEPQQIRRQTLIAKSFYLVRGGKIPESATFDVHALRALASPKVPQPVREQAVARATKGEHITAAKAKEMIDAAVRKAKKEQADAVRKDMQAAIDEATTRARELEAELKSAEGDLEEQQQKAVNEATQSLAAEVVTLKSKLGEIETAGQKKPDIKEIEAIFKRRLGIKKLNDDQWSLMAQMLGEAISVGSKGYLPISFQDLRKNEDTFRMVATAIEHVQGIAGAISADIIIPAALPIQRRMMADALPGIIKWAQDCMTALKPYKGEKV